ncbi:MAG: glycosyltransferase family 1 protein [Bacteroidota bacterium]
MHIELLSCANTRCGIGRYTNELGQHLANTPHQVHGLRKDSPDSRVFDVYPHRSFRNLRHYVAPVYLAKALKSLQADVFLADYVDAASSFFWHVPKQPYLLFTNVHDAIPFMYPTSGIAFNVYRQQLKFAISHSYNILVVSEASKKDLVMYTGIEPDRVEVVHNGINHHMFYPDKQKKKNDIFTIRYVGGLSGAHKNAELLIHAAHTLEQRGLNFNMEIGGGYPENTVLPELVKSLNVQSVTFKGFIPDDELRSFYAGADLFLYPSKYEGFGFPPLEAMACGTATVSSKAGSLEEVLGYGAITVSPESHTLAMAVETVMRQPNLKKDLEQRAVQRASEFTWQKSAEKHLAVFEKALSNVRLQRRVS